MPFFQPFVPQVAFYPQRTKCFAPTRPQHNRSFNQDFLPFLNVIDETFNEISKAAERQQQLYRQSQEALKTRFDVYETQKGYQIDGELPGVDQKDIDIEFTDDQTLIVKGKSERRSETTSKLPQAEEPQQIEDPAAAPEAPEADKHSETSSVKSHQATVEDDFEDLAEDSDTLSAVSTTDKGKQRAAEEVATPATEPAETAPEQPQQAPQADQHQEPKSRSWVSERSFGSFSRTFKFPVRVNTDAVKASLKNGVLSITVPKAPVPEVRRIWVE